MKIFLTYALLFAVAGVGLLLQDESFIFKTVLFLAVAVPILWIALLKYLTEQEKQIKELERRVYELENKRR